MEPIKFNFPPDVAVTFVNQMVESAKSDPDASEKQRAVFEDIQTLVNLARKQLVATQAPAPAEPGNNHKS